MAGGTCFKFILLTFLGSLLFYGEINAVKVAFVTLAPPDDFGWSYEFDQGKPKYSRFIPTIFSQHQIVSFIIVADNVFPGMRYLNYHIGFDVELENLYVVCLLLASFGHFTLT